MLCCLFIFFRVMFELNQIQFSLFYCKLLKFAKMNKNSLKTENDFSRNVFMNFQCIKSQFMFQSISAQKRRCSIKIFTVLSSFLLFFLRFCRVVLFLYFADALMQFIQISVSPESFYHVLIIHFLYSKFNNKILLQILRRCIQCEKLNFSY